MTVTTWLPDTCQCIIDYETDPQQPALGITSVSTKVIGAEHGHLTGVGLWNAVFDENRRKNFSLGLVEELFPQLNMDTEVFWLYDLTRLLHIQIKAGLLAKVDRERLQTDCNNRFGLLKVLVEEKPV